uniref:Uncharacterized protein n=1 Tax=Anguilla anguilla TaxID=7936 RepID=A0A0E9TB33_ANGAN
MHKKTHQVSTKENFSIMPQLIKHLNTVTYTHPVMTKVL